MMMKKKNSNWERLKYLVVFPVAAFAVALFARPEISTRLDKISEVKVSTFTSFIEENSQNYADTVKVRPEKKREKAIKVPDLPDDPQQINHSKEWEEFFKTTSLQEFMGMVKEIKLNIDSLTQLNVGSFQSNFDSLLLNKDSLMQLNFSNYLFNDSVRVAWRKNADRLRMQSKEQIQKQKEEIMRHNELMKVEVQRQKEEIKRQSELMKAEAQRQKEEIKRQSELMKAEAQRQNELMKGEIQRQKEEIKRQNELKKKEQLSK